jgi:hypothetical protein
MDKDLLTMKTSPVHTPLNPLQAFANLRKNSPSPFNNDSEAARRLERREAILNLYRLADQEHNAGNENEAEFYAILAQSATSADLRPLPAAGGMA